MLRGEKEMVEKEHNQFLVVFYFWDSSFSGLTRSIHGWCGGAIFRLERESEGFLFGSCLVTCTQHCFLFFLVCVFFLQLIGG